MLLLGTAELGHAQYGLSDRISVAPQVGVSIPTRQFGDYFEPGPGAGVRIVYQLSPLTSIATTLGVDLLRGGTLGNGETTAPDLQARYLGIQAEHDVVTTEFAPVAFRIYGGGGAAQYRSDPFQAGSAPRTELNQIRPFFTAGGELGYPVGSVELFAHSGVRWSPIDHKDAFVKALAVENYRPFAPLKSAWNFAVQFGARLAR